MVADWDNMAVAVVGKFAADNMAVVVVDKVVEDKYYKDFALEA